MNVYTPVYTHTNTVYIPTQTCLCGIYTSASAFVCLGKPRGICLSWEATSVYTQYLCVLGSHTVFVCRGKPQVHTHSICVSWEATGVYTRYLCVCVYSSMHINHSSSMYTVCVCVCVCVCACVCVCIH